MFFASCKTRFCDLGTKSTHFQCLTLDAINRHLKSIRQTWQSCGKWYPNVLYLRSISLILPSALPVLNSTSSLPHHLSSKPTTFISYLNNFNLFLPNAVQISSCLHASHYISYFSLSSGPYTFLSLLQSRRHRNDLETEIKVKVCSFYIL